MGRFLKKLQFIIEVLSVYQLKEHVLSFYINHLTFPKRVPTQSYPFRRNFGRSGKGSFKKRAATFREGAESRVGASAL